MNIEVGFIGDINLDFKDLDSTFDTNHVIVTPGQVITEEAGFLRGHGTYQGLYEYVIVVVCY